jgi:hypothetical protein
MLPDRMAMQLRRTYYVARNTDDHQTVHGADRNRHRCFDGRDTVGALPRLSGEGRRVLLAWPHSGGAIFWASVGQLKFHRNAGLVREFNERADNSGASR